MATAMKNAIVPTRNPTAIVNMWPPLLLRHVAMQDNRNPFTVNALDAVYCVAKGKGFVTSEEVIVKLERLNHRRGCSALCQVKADAPQVVRPRATQACYRSFLVRAGEQLRTSSPQRGISCADGCRFVSSPARKAPAGQDRALSGQDD
jgi:hypothetical protein